MSLTFGTKTFLAAFVSAAAALAVAATWLTVTTARQVETRIERTLIAETRMAADLLSHRVPVASPTELDELDEEADRLAATVNARVTLIDASGRVVGDSAEDGASLAALESHAGRPEVVEARRSGLGVSRRYSTTVGADLLYVAVPVRHPSIAVVRLALPLGGIAEQRRAVRTSTLVALGFAAAMALAVAAIFATRLARRVRRIAAVARRYGHGDLTAEPIHFGDDEIGAVARAMDQSARELGRRLAEQARDRARTEAILSGMVEGVLVIDEEGRLQLANEAAKQMLKLPPDVVGRHYLEAIRHPWVEAQLSAALAGRRPEGLELGLPADDRTFIARAAPAAAAGGGAVLVLHDITDLRRADRIRRDFVANVSHELRTPLTAIRGYVEALADEPEAEDRRRFIEVIARHTSRMERLVHDLLRLARLDAGQELLEIAPADAGRLFDAVVADLSARVAEKNLRIETRIGDGAQQLMADAAKLHDVLRNLVENALSYSPPGGTVELASSADTADIVVTVADRGPGIPASDLERVFERFYRVDKSRARDPGGTGLGLSIVKHLVELHEGHVSAANRPGGGAVFTIRLPKRGLEA